MSAKFFKVIQEGDRDKVETMLRKTPDLILSKSKKNLSPLLTAMYYHEFEIADLLLDRMVKLTVYEAAATGKMKHLISNLGHKPELVNAYSDDGYQPLGLAAYFGHEQVVEYLIKAGAEVNSSSKNALGVTPLQSAVAGGHLEITRMLLTAGASPNVREGGGYTPLHTAAHNGDVEIVRSLIFGGADLEAKSDKDETPLDMARKAGHDEVVSLLKAGITRRFRGSRLPK
ncbi:MAG: ankyrin repeat domain-containing protein [Anaerolineales bacterium]|jgi:ankyrin repeat protein